MRKTARDRLPATFWWANFTQFGGAMNDNLFKLFMIYALIDWNGAENRTEIIGAVTLIFAVPFLIFIPIAGSFSDHFSKRSIIVILKGLEIGVMSVGLVGLLMQSPALLYVTIFLMSSQSAFFGPCKYGIIPEQVGPARLSKANGMIQMFTYMAILAGTVVAPAMSEYFGDYHARAASICLMVAAIGFICSLQIAPSPAHPMRQINLNGFVNLYRTTHLIRRDGFLSLAVLGGSIFMLIGAFMQMNILDFGAEHLGYTEEQSTRLFLLTAIGIGAGSVFAGWISGRSIEFGIVPMGTAIMFACLIVIGTVPEGSVWAVRVAMLLIGVGAGMYIVPLEAFIQYRSPKDKVGSIKAANGFLGWIGVVLASRLLIINESVFNLNAQEGFLVVSVGLFLLAVLSFWILPDFFVKFVIMCIVRTCYRLRVLGIGNLPTNKAALLVCNHVSLMDALLVISSQQRRIRVVMSRRVFNSANVFIRKIVTFAGVILIQDSDGPKQLIRSLKEARQALDDGFLVCIFAEGSLTLSGMMRPFKPGFERIIKGTEHPIIPVYIGGAWGSHASWKRGRAKINPVGDFRHPVSVHFGAELPSSSTVAEVQQAVCEVSAETHELTKSQNHHLGLEFLRIAGKNWRQPAILDAQGNQIDYATVTAQALETLSWLRQRLEPGETRIGILSQNGPHVTILNVSLALGNLIAVPLDPGDSGSALCTKIKKAALRTVVTDAVERLNGMAVNPVQIGELLTETGGAKSCGLEWRAKWFPGSLLRGVPAGPDDDCTIQFTRGTTGEPKAVRLSHRNILFNAEALRELISTSEKDVVMGVIPQSNILGYTATTWLPLLSGMAVAYSGEPLDPVGAGALCERLKATIIPATPGFLAACTVSVDAACFKTLRYVFTGGDRLDPGVAGDFERKFGIAPLEAYGATELAPVCSLSLPDIAVGRFAEKGRKSNSAGRLLQGIAVKIMDPDTQQSQPAGQTGIIHVKGPNVMQGYFNDPQRTSRFLDDNWYDTGDLGYLDEAGFLTIVGRFAR